MGNNGFLQVWVFPQLRDSLPKSLDTRPATPGSWAVGLSDWAAAWSREVGVRRPEPESCPHVWAPTDSWSPCGGTTSTTAGHSSRQWAPPSPSAQLSQPHFLLLCPHFHSRDTPGNCERTQKAFVYTVSKHTRLEETLAASVTEGS